MKMIHPASTEPVALIPAATVVSAIAMLICRAHDPFIGSLVQLSVKKVLASDPMSLTQYVTQSSDEADVGEGARPVLTASKSSQCLPFIHLVNFMKSYIFKVRHSEIRASAVARHSSHTHTLIFLKAVSTQAFS